MRSATCKSPRNEGTQLRSQRQNDLIIVIEKHEVPGAISSEEFFAGDSREMDLFFNLQNIGKSSLQSKLFFVL